jgi:hypothetical protein
VQDPSKPIWVNKEPIKELPELEIDTADFSIFVATPVHSDVSIHYCQALLEFQQYCFAHKVRAQFQLMKSSLVTQGRNLCVGAFMESNMTHMLFVDSDIDFQASSIFKMIAADHEVTAVPYPLKSMQWEKLYEKIKNNEITSIKELSTRGYTYPMKVENEKDINVKNGMMEVSHVPTGCLLIKRSVIEKMIKAYPQLRIDQPTIINGETVDKEFIYNFFDTWFDEENHKYYGEDFAFCKRWTDIGGKCYAYIMDYITHVGEHQYCGKFIDELIFPKK